MKFVLGKFAVVCALFAAGSSVIRVEAIESRQVQFSKGSSSITVKGSLKGDKFIDYKLGAKAGQTMNVTLKTSNGATTSTCSRPAPTMWPSSSVRRVATNGSARSRPMANTRFVSI